jgi:hypothetical protein
MVNDLGLNANRKQGWADITTPYGPPDYKGLVDQWIERNEGVKS